MLANCSRALSKTTALAATAPQLAARTMASQRPISPHVTIYKFPVEAISSITTRVTGSALTVGMLGMGTMGAFGSCDLTPCIESFQTSAPLAVPLAKFSVAFPLVYHYAAGMRHLVWDATAKGLDLQTTKTSSYALLGGSAGVCVLLAAYSQ